MTAIIYEIKHNSALRQVGQLSRSLNKSPLFTAHNDLIVKYQKVSHSRRHQKAGNRFTDLSLAQHDHFFVYSIQTKWNTCKLCYLQAVPTQAVFVHDRRLNYSTRGVVAPVWRSSAEWEMPVSGQYACSRGISLQEAAAADGMLTLSSTFSTLLARSN